MKIEETGNLILDLSFKFALDIISFAEILESQRRITKKHHINKESIE